MIKSTIKSLLVALILCPGFSMAQNPFYWQQYGSYNPGAAGVEDSLTFISSLSTFDRYTISRSSMNYRSKKIHGGLSAGYHGLYKKDSYANNGLNLNYSFHAKLGERSVLGIGVGMNYNNMRYLQDGKVVYEGNDYTGSFGVHFQSGRLRAGTSFTPTFNVQGFGQQLGWSSVYADYTFKLNEKWGLQTGLAAGPQFSYLTFTAKYTDKLWFGTNLGRSDQNVFVGMNLKQGVSLGAAVGVYSFPSKQQFAGSVFLKAQLSELFGK